MTIGAQLKAKGADLSALHEMGREVSRRRDRRLREQLIAAGKIIPAKERRQ